MFESLNLDNGNSFNVLIFMKNVFICLLLCYILVIIVNLCYIKIKRCISKKNIKEDFSKEDADVFFWFSFVPLCNLALLLSVIWDICKYIILFIINKCYVKKFFMKMKNFFIE